MRGKEKVVIVQRQDRNTQIHPVRDLERCLSRIHSQAFHSLKYINTTYTPNYEEMTDTQLY